MNDVIDMVAAFLIGALVGMGELVGRYRDEPGRAVRSRPALIYMTINGAASLAALALAHTFGWTFGAASGTPEARVTQVLVAGFGAMAVFRSSLFLYRVGNKEVGIGPVAFLQVVLDATDRGVDRHRAQARSTWVRRIMSGLDFKEVAIALPAYAIGLMQNLSESDQSLLFKRVEDVGKSPQDDRMKVMSLGLLVMDAVGEVVLEEAVLTVRKELGHELPRQAVGMRPLSNVLSRVRSTPDAPPTAAAETPPKAGADAPPKAATETPPKAGGDVPPKAGGDAPPKAAAETPPKAGADAPPKAATDRKPPERSNRSGRPD